MLCFPTDEKPPRSDRPHIKADGRTIVFTMPRGNRVGYAEGGAVAETAKAVLFYQRRAIARHAIVSLHVTRC